MKAGTQEQRRLVWLIGEALQSDGLAATRRRALEQELERLRRQFERHVAAWEQR